MSCQGTCGFGIFMQALQVARRVVFRVVFFTELPTCDRTAGMCFQRQSQGVVGRTEIGSSGFRMCTFMQIFNMMIYLFSKFHLLFFGSDGVLHLWMVMPFLVDKNGDRFHKETVYLSLSGGFKHFWKFHISHLFEGRWTHFDFCIFFRFVGSTISHIVGLGGERPHVTFHDVDDQAARWGIGFARKKVVVPHVLNLC